MYRAKKIILPVFLTVLLLVTGLSLYYIYYNQWQEQALGVSSDLVDVVNKEDQDSDQTKDLQTIIHDAEKHVVQCRDNRPLRPKTLFRFCLTMTKAMW